MIQKIHDLTFHLSDQAAQLLSYLSQCSSNQELYLGRHNRSRFCCLTVSTVSVSTTNGHLSHYPFGKSDFTPVLHVRCVLIGFELLIIVRKFVEEDRDWKAVEDDPKRDAEESKQASQKCLWIDVPVTNRGDADLQGTGKGQRSLGEA